MPLSHIQSLPVRIDFDANTPFAVQLAGQINCIIAKGQLREGDLLPQIRRLAQQLDLNPNTVARAYEELSAAGVLIKRQGSGCYVKAPPPDRKPADRLRPLSASIEELVTNARSLGVSIPELIAELGRHDPAEIKPVAAPVAARPKRMAPKPPTPAAQPPAIASLWQATGDWVD